MKNQQLNKTTCPECNGKTMVGFRQGAYNPNPISKNTGKRICMDCYMEETWKRLGVEC